MDEPPKISKEEFSQILVMASELHFNDLVELSRPELEKRPQVKGLLDELLRLTLVRDALAVKKMKVRLFIDAGADRREQYLKRTAGPDASKIERIIHDDWVINPNGRIEEIAALGRAALRSSR